MNNTRSDKQTDRPNVEKPLVYSCSGCSNVAQLANDVAVALNIEGVAQMSCIAGVGGDVKPLVKLALSGRPILAIDGCGLACVKCSLARHGIAPTWHMELTACGVKKSYERAYNPGERNRVLSQARDLLPCHRIHCVEIASLD